MSSILGQILSKLADAEIVAAQPVLDNFFGWVEANPGDATNPLTAGAQVTKLGIDFLAVQTQAKDTSVLGVTKLIHAAVDALAAKALAKVAPQVPSQVTPPVTLAVGTTIPPAPSPAT